MVCINVGNEFCKPPAWYRLGSEVAAAPPQRERGLQEMTPFDPVVAISEPGGSCSCYIIGLACLVMFVICLHVIKRKFQQLCSKCGGRILCQGLRSIEQLLVKVGGIEQRMVVLEDILQSACPSKKQAEHKRDVGTQQGKVSEQLITAHLDKPLHSDQSD